MLSIAAYAIKRLGEDNVELTSSRGLTAWLAKADYVLIFMHLLCLALVGLGLYRRRLRRE